MSYSIDFRGKVISTREEEGLSIRETAKQFRIGPASVSRWINQIASKASTTRQRKSDKSELIKDVEPYPDAYQKERAERFGVCQKAIWHALKKLGLTYKKTLCHPKADESARQAFQKKQQYEKEGKPIVFIDEIGFPHDTPWTHGYSQKDQRCFGLKNWGAKGRTNVIGALLGTTLFAIGLFDININSDVFYSWVTQVLIPVLPKNSVIVMDNATFHKKHNIQQVIIDAGYMLEYLPTYSPDLNPIEHKWAQAKSKKREVVAIQRFCSQSIWCNQN
ncbi:IS630 family transposase [Symbiopectobacterium sp. RP]|uniref:IS630 family transposase n=1 Tax=Symbiopectobacterium sp. RP TaxID=3248553 RepID=UPI003D298859